MTNRPGTAYEVAVYQEDGQRAERLVLAALAELATISDQRVRAALIAGTLVTCAQLLDGSTDDDFMTMPRDGIAHRMRGLLELKSVGRQRA